MADLIEKDGRRRRNAIVIECRECGKEVISRADQVRKYCSPECARKSRHNRIKLTCAYCHRQFERPLNKKTNSKHSVFFCCRQHKDWGQRIEHGIPAIHPPHYAGGASEYRNRALRQKGPRCQGCGYFELEGMLDVHHVDGDRSNGEIANLAVLCVFCHALITRGYADIAADGKMYKKGP